MSALRRLAVLLASIGLLQACSNSQFLDDQSTSSPSFEVDPPAGLAQSPIAIAPNLVTRVRPGSLPRLAFRYGGNVSLDVVNTGSPDEDATIRANVPSGTAFLLVGDISYELLQFHFHALSEHVVNGRPAPLEMHLVHRSSGGQLMVIGVQVVEGPANQALSRIFEGLPDEPGEHASVAGFPLQSLVAGSTASYRYGGSLTTPPFTEGVNWVVLATPITLTAAQLDRFEAIFPDGNSRAVQPLNGRRILSDVR